jgi:hypothetical protein
MDGTQHLLGVGRVDVTQQRKSGQAHRLLTVHDDDDPGTALALDLGDHAGPHRLEQSLLEHRLQGGECDE